jgi:hypothetical protein
MLSVVAQAVALPRLTSKESMRKSASTFAIYLEASPVMHALLGSISQIDQRKKGVIDEHEEQDRHIHK